MKPEKTAKVIIDGTNAVMGRLASYAAKQALLGKEIIIVNANRVRINGNKKNIVDETARAIKRGGSSMKGPKIERNPERMLKREIRGMLSHKQGRGQKAVNRIMCYNETPKEYEETKKIIAGKEKGGRFIELKELARLVK